jgi:serine/threonine protein kinase
MFKNKNIIGQGGFGIIFEAEMNNETVIVKRIKTKNNSNEIIFLKKLKNIPGIVKYLNHFHHSNFTFIIMQKIPNTIDLFTHISQKTRLHSTTAQIILTQLITILTWCKNKNVFHNDIKDENILIDPNTLQITLIDFGASQPWNKDSFYFYYEGTLVYASPEWILQGKYTACNMTVWSLGILLFNMLFGNVPFLSKKEIIQSKYQIPTDIEIPILCKDLLGRCLQNNPLQRIKFDQLIYHPWLKSSFNSL